MSTSISRRFWLDYIFCVDTFKPFDITSRDVESCINALDALICVASKKYTYDLWLARVLRFNRIMAVHSMPGALTIPADLRVSVFAAYVRADSQMYNIMNLSPSLVSQAIKAAEAQQSNRRLYYD